MEFDSGKGDSSSSRFTLAGADDGFGSRSRDVFAALGGLEDEHDSYLKSRARTLPTTDDIGLVKDDPCEEPPLGSRKSNVQPRPMQRGNTRGFKRPISLPPRSRAPGYKKNPEKWTFYDLSDVSKDDLSERGNTAAALSFLQEAKRRKTSSTHDSGEREHLEDVDMGDDSVSKTTNLPIKHRFSRPSASARSAEKGAEVMGGCGSMACTSGGKLVMPEYVVGQKNKEKRQSSKGNLSAKQKQSSNSSAIRIEHLDDEVGTAAQTANEKDEETRSQCQVISKKLDSSPENMDNTGKGGTVGMETEGSVTFKKTSRIHRCVRKRDDSPSSDG